MSDELFEKKSIIDLYKYFDQYKEENQSNEIENYIVSFFDDYYYVGEINDDGLSLLTFSNSWIIPGEVVIRCDILNSKEFNKVHSNDCGYCIIDKNKISKEELLELVNKLNEQLQK